MNLCRFSNHLIDIEQILETEWEPSKVTLVFKNGDRVQVPWRDPLEKAELVRQLDSPAKAS